MCLGWVPGRPFRVQDGGDGKEERCICEVIERDGRRGTPMRNGRHQEVYRAILGKRAGICLSIDGVWVERQNTYLVG